MEKTAFQSYCEYMGEMPDVSRHIPQPSLKERDRRWKMIRTMMQEESLDCLLVWGSDAQFGLCEANFRYLTAILSQGRSLAVFPAEGEPIAFVGTGHDTFESLCYSWVKDVRTIPYLEDVAEALRSLDLGRSRIGVVGNTPGYWPFIEQYPIVPQLQSSFPEAEFLDVGKKYWDLQLIKSAEEIGLLKKAGEIAEKVYRALVENAKPGIRECELYAEMLRALVANGGEPNSMLLMDSGNPVFAHPKHPPVSTRTLQQGDMVVVEYHVKYAGMVTHTERTVSLGAPDEKTERLYRICQEAYQASLEHMYVGTTLRDAVLALREPVRREGLAYLECGYHSHGCTSGGYPSYNGTDEGTTEVADVIIKENMVFTQEVDLFDPKWKHGKGVVLADSFVVTDAGAQVLASIPTELAIV